MAAKAHPISAATFRAPVLRALGTLSNLRANAPVTRKDVIAAVLAETGYVIGQFGGLASGKEYVAWAIGRAYFLMKRDEHLTATTMKRGMWGLSDSGVKVAATLLGAPAPAAAAIPDVATPDVATTVATTVAAMADVDPATLVIPEPTDEVPEAPAAAPAADTAEPLAAAPAKAAKPKAKVKAKVKASIDGGDGVAFTVSLDGNDTYNADPYIRSLAIQSTSCFGQFSTRSRVCGDCPLSVACKSKMVATMSSLAGTLRQRDTEAIIRAKAEAERKLARAAKADVDETTMLPGTKAVEGLVTDETIDDIMDELEGGTTTVKASAAPAPAVPTGGEIIEAVVPTICAKCNTTISTGEKCVWLAGQGVYHSPSCP